MRRAPLLLTRLCAAWLALSCVTARAEVESEQVKAGVAAYDALEFGRSIELLEKALSESLTREEKIVAYRTIAFANIAVERPDQARTAFARLLRIDPSAELDKRVAPKARALFEEARAQVATGKAEPAESTLLPTLELSLSPAQPKEGASLTLSAVAPGGLGRSAALFHRVRGQPHYSEIKVQGRDGHFIFTVPSDSVRAPGLEYYVVALDERQVAIARSGTLLEPIALALAARPSSRPRPLYKRAWLWGTIGGVLVAGAVLGAVLGTTLSSPSSKSSADVQLIAR